MQAHLDNPIAVPRAEALDAAASERPLVAAAGARAQARLTVPAWLAERVELVPDAIALRFKQRGIWHALSWRELTVEARELAAGLARAGLLPGDGLAVLGDGSPRVLIAALAALQLGGHVVVLDAAQPAARELREQALRAAGARALFVVGKTELDKVVDYAALNAGAARAWLRIVYSDARGLLGRPGLTPYDELRTSGRLALAQGASTDPELTVQGLAFAVARTGGSARLISHEALTRDARELTDGLAAADLLALDALLGSAMLEAGLSLWLRGRARINIPETQASVLRDGREIGPSLSVAESGAYDALRAHVDARLPAQGSWRRRWLERALHGSAQSAFVRKLDHWLVVRPLRRVLGVSRLRHALVVGPGVDAPTRELFAGLGIALRSETTSS